MAPFVNSTSPLVLLKKKNQERVMKRIACPSCWLIVMLPSYAEVPFIAFVIIQMVMYSS